MEYVVWSEMFSVKVPYLDKQHQKLFEIINDFHTFLKAGRGEDILFTVLNELIQFAQRHFQDEETILRAAGYDPQHLQMHMQAHETMLADIFALNEEFARGDKRSLYDVEHFLNNWLIKHILATDKEYELVCSKLTASQIQKSLARS